MTLKGVEAKEAFACSEVANVGEDRNLNEEPAAQHPANWIDMTGRALGRFVVVRPTHSDWRGNQHWEIRCERCAWTTTRSGGDLRRQAADGRVPRCAPCYRRHRYDQLARTALEYGTWWMPLQVDQLVSEVVDDLELAGHRAPSLGGHGLLAAEPQSTGIYTPEERVAYVHEVAVPVDMYLSCVECAAKFSSGFGCVACIEPLCPACSRGAHVCVAARQCEFTLEQVGRHIGVTRERTRQLEARALGQLRKRFGDLRHLLEAA